MTLDYDTKNVVVVALQFNNSIGRCLTAIAELVGGEVGDTGTNLKTGEQDIDYLFPNKKCAEEFEFMLRQLTSNKTKIKMNFR